MGKCNMCVQHLGREPYTTHTVLEAAIFSNFRNGDCRSECALNMCVRSIGKDHAYHMNLLFLSLSAYPLQVKLIAKTSPCPSLCGPV